MIGFTLFAALGFAALWMPGFASGLACPQDPVRREKPLEKLNPCVGCVLVANAKNGYVRGVRVREQPARKGLARVVALSDLSRSGTCREIAARCLELAPCALVSMALVHNASAQSLWMRVDRDFVRTPWTPPPDRGGWIEIPKGGFAF